MRVLSGLQPSGKFHLGNYFGSIKPNIDLQDSSDQSFLIVVDLHALTTVHDPKVLRENTIDNALDFLACGLDSTKTIFFRQSDVPEHAELMWILSTLCPMGLLERAVSFKDKVGQGIEASAGLFLYPVLQTADIVLYDINKVPVGGDQKQHLEMARDITIKFNNTYGDVLTVPEAVIKEDVAVVPGVDGQKMSKSYNNTIPLFGDEKKAQKAIMSITTDSKGASDPKDPETCVIYKIHSLLLSEGDQKSLADEYRNGLAYGDAKKKLYEDYMDYFKDMRARREKLTEKDAQDVLLQGKERASAAAKVTMAKVKAAVGLN